MSLLIRRIGRGLKACWSVRGSTYPRGTHLIVFAIACFLLAQSAWDGRAFNIMDLTIALLTGYLVASAFIEGFRSEDT
ncbi:hypothetical protein WL29_20870 [Burkholderia ubonensis]|uniref:Uncharacterized protein n=1 Tax=Burkholderia ubonensis TaxID=101571 RepID=A0A125DMB0_9BURK|nr:hypothetical protein [Burkholderia ubonensis]KWA83820.1 hypothetical protein WL29_20870 [Burkholderia ubonensis]